MDGLTRIQRRIAKAAGARQVPRTSRTYRPWLGVERFEERTLLSVALVSVNAAGTASGNSDSSFFDSNSSGSMGPTPDKTSMSADGKSVAFQSDATDLVGGVSDANKATDVFVRNVQTGQTQLVSATPDGKVGNGRSFQPIISPDGRYVAFLSLATSTWFAIGGVISSVANSIGERNAPALRPGEEALSSDMSTTSLVGGGLIAGDALAALGLGIAGLLATVAG